MLLVLHHVVGHTYCCWSYIMLVVLHYAVDPREAPPEPYFLQPLSLWRALRESPRGSATGPTGWSYELLTPLLQNTDEEAHRAWEKVANLLANGAVPDACRTWFGAAYLGGISITDGGVRPIAAGEVLRRWMGKAMLTQDRDEPPSGRGRRPGRG